MNREHRLGLVLLVTGLLIVGLGLAGVAWRESRALYYTLVFKDARGLQAGDPVRLGGVEVGRVKWVQLNPNPTRAQVRVKVAPQYAALVRVDSTAWINDEAGKRAVEVINADSQPPAPPLPKDAVIQGKENRLDLQVWKLKTQLHGAGDALAVAIGALGDQLKEIGDSLKELSASPEMEQATRDLRDFMKKMQAQGRQAAGELQAEWPKIREDMKPVLRHLAAMGRAYMAEEIQGMLRQIDQTLEEWRRHPTPTPTPGTRP